MAGSLFCQRLPAGDLPARLSGMGVSPLDDTGLLQNILFNGDPTDEEMWGIWATLRG